ncbi:hypothetical protein ACP4OV_019435 [Aristida adscensionis]
MPWCVVAVGLHIALPPWTTNVGSCVLGHHGTLGALTPDLRCRVPRGRHLPLPHHHRGGEDELTKQQLDRLLASSDGVGAQHPDVVMRETLLSSAGAEQEAVREATEVERDLLELLQLFLDALVHGGLSRGAGPTRSQKMPRAPGRRRRCRDGRRAARLRLCCGGDAMDESRERREVERRNRRAGSSGKEQKRESGGTYTPGDGL